jgi:tetratricopeptide (TPR) repeat protein
MVGNIGCDGDTAMHPTGKQRTRSWLTICSCLLLWAAMLPALAHEHDSVGDSKPSVVLGHLSFPTSTHSRPAQAAFEQGMLWLHLFEYEHAAEQFQQAERLDPGFAMAYWGEAMTHTHAIWNQDDPAAARAALAKLGATPQARAAKAPTAREQAWLDAAEKLFGPGTLRERDAAFLQAMAAMSKAYPRDDEAQLFYSLALLGVTRGERNIPNYLHAAAIAKRVYAHNPEHPGAAHYWIHGMDDPDHAAGALVAARALSKIAPGAGHAQHMVSHIFMALGMWKDVASANEIAIRVIADERRAAHRPMVTCGHYAEWLQYSYYQLDRQRDAQNVLDQCMAEGKAALDWYRAHPDQSIPGGMSVSRMKARYDDSFVTMRATAIVESETDRARNAAVVLDVSDVGRAAGWDAFGRGYAAAKAGDGATATSALAALQAIAKQPPGEGETPAQTEYLEILGKLLQSVIAQSAGHIDEAIAAATEAARRYDALPFDFGPPVPVKPPHELLGELLLQAGRPKDALTEFDRSLKTAPRRALSMMGRTHALAASAAAPAH